MLAPSAPQHSKEPRRHARALAFRSAQILPPHFRSIAFILVLNIMDINLVVWYKGQAKKSFRNKGHIWKIKRTPKEIAKKIKSK